MAERKKSSSSGSRSSSSSRSSSKPAASSKSPARKRAAAKSKSTGTGKRATKRAAKPKQSDPLASQGMGEDEDFANRDYVIPGVDADDPQPYKWHTGRKRDHGGQDAIEIIDLVKQFGGTAPQELSLIGKQLLYIERYTKVLAPDYQVIADPFIMKNIFPEEAARKAAELGVPFPD